MKKIVLIAISLLALNSFAATTTAVVGGRSNHGVMTSGTSNDQINLQAGVIVGVPLNDTLSFRTGGVLAMKDTQNEISPIKITEKRLFLDIPATLQFGNETIQGYAGIDLGLKLSSSCDADGIGSCTILDEKSLVVQPVLGFDVAVAPTIKVGAFYELETEYSKNFKMSAYGVNVGFNF
jgi:hypothetical protein